MGLRQLEAEILRELREVTGRHKIRQKDIMEWSSADIDVVEVGEAKVYLPGLKILRLLRG